MAGRQGPFPGGRSSSVVLDDEKTARVRLFIGAIGLRKAIARLRVGAETIDAARSFGRLQSGTASRLLEALEREEAALREAS